MTTRPDYTLYCGNPECPDRLRLWPVAIEDIPDGEPWYCPDCQPEE